MGGQQARYTGILLSKKFITKKNKKFKQATTKGAPGCWCRNREFLPSRLADFLIHISSTLIYFFWLLLLLLRNNLYNATDLLIINFVSLSSQCFSTDSSCQQSLVLQRLNSYLVTKMRYLQFTLIMISLSFPCE